MSDDAGRYQASYSRFHDNLSALIRKEVYGEDIGQFSWTTADEMRSFAAGLELSPETHVLEIGCGAGGPALFLAQITGARVTGIDINQAGIEAAEVAAKTLGLEDRASFLAVDGGSTLPFAPASLDAVLLVDAINHIPDRGALFAETYRVLKPGGRLLYTDPVVVTGPVTAEEVAVRSSIGFFVFMPVGANERLLEQTGFALVAKEDRTENIAGVTGRGVAVRERRRDEIVAAGGQESFDKSLRFYRVTHKLSSSRRLSRLMFLARKP